SSSAEAVGGRGPTSESRAATGGGGRASGKCTGPASGSAKGSAAGHDHATGGKARSDSCAGAELRAAGDKTVGDAGTE
ncbi:hypothetical protein J8J27_35060, partial [Mycobacterium tuberculosis]|nr:hypothetical protein [Mycobacterium tuberculosis]